MPSPALILLLVASLIALFDTPSASASDPLYDLSEEEFNTELIGAVGGVLDHRVNWRSARPKTFNGHVYFTYIDPNYHPRIAKLSLNNGTVETDWVVDSTYTLTKQNDGHYYFTLGIDPDGYIHVVGNMHNGDSVNINHWRSNNPEDISAFTLKQGSEGPQGDYFTYPHMRNDLNGNLYHWARIYREAPWPVKFGIGLSAHDVASQQWSMIGAPVPGGDQSRTVTTWEDNNEGNGSYQQPRLMIHFDRNNRMHITTLLLNHTPSSYAGSPHFGTDVLYAYSDDGGQTIHKSDGSQIQWPMRVESGAYQGEIVFSDYSDYLNLAVFLATDRDNNPIILAGTHTASDSWHLLRRESGTWVDYGNLGNDSPFGGLLRDPWGVVTLQLDDNKIIRFWDPDSPVEIDLPHKPIFVSPTQSSSIDASWMRDTGEMIYTVEDSANDQIKLYRTRISRPGGNNPPVFTADPIDKSNATEGAAYSDTIAGTATDADSDPLSYSKVSGPAWLNVASDGTLSGTPNNSDVGANAFAVEVDDGNGGTDTAVLNITVVNVDDAPPYEVWKTNYGITDDLADDDNDGIANMLEFALGGNPKSADAGSRRPTVTRNGSVYEFIFYRGEASLDYTVESSLDLDRWESLATVDDSHGPVGSTATVPVPDSENGSSTIFLRLKVEN